MVATEMPLAMPHTLEVYNATVGAEPCRTGPAVLGQKPRQRIVTTFHLSGGLVAIAAVACPVDLAGELVSQLLDTHLESVSAVIFDATIEIANVVMGTVREALGSEIVGLQISAPSVISEALSPKGRSNLGRIRMAFSCAENRFEMTVAILKQTAFY